MTTTDRRRLGKYEIIEEVGRGGFGVVYKAVDTTLQRTVALKVLAAYLLSDPTFIASFQQEAQMAAALEHPNIVTIWEVGEIETTYYIAMRYVDGRPLSRLLEQDGPLPLTRTAYLLDQIAAALDHAHQCGVTHRDLKPSNILVDADDAVTVTDFGLAKASSVSGLTATGQMPGTPAYMAPEQLDVDRQDEVGPGSDIYALGLVVYEMLAGAPPFVGPTPALIAAHLLKDAPPLRQRRTDLPLKVGDVIDRALAKSPDERPRTAGELAGVLRAATEAVDRERQQAHLAQLYEQAMQHLAAGQWEAAGRALAQVLDSDPAFRDAAVHLASVRRGRALDKMYEGVRAAADAKDWPLVVELGTELLSRTPDYKDTAGMIRRARKAVLLPEERRRPPRIALPAVLAVLVLCAVTSVVLVTQVVLPRWFSARPTTTAAEPTATSALAIAPTATQPLPTATRQPGEAAPPTATAAPPTATSAAPVETAEPSAPTLAPAPAMPPPDTPVPPTPMITPAAEPRLVVRAADTHVRSGPGMAYPSLGTAEEGQQFGIAGRDETGDWWLICCLAEKLGWVHAPLVDVSGPTDGVGIVTEIPPPPATATTVPYSGLLAAPTLLGPADGEQFDGADAVIVLEWTPMEGLAPDDHYVVHITHRLGLDSQWTKETTLQPPSYLYDLGKDDRHYEWYVVVMRLTGERADGVKEGYATGKPSETRSFIWWRGSEPKSSGPTRAPGPTRQS